MKNNEFKEPTKLELIERIVKKSTVHENEIDGKCVFISIEHIDLLIKDFKELRADYKVYIEMHRSTKEKYRNALKEIVTLIDEKKYGEAEIVAFDTLGDW